MTERGLGRRPPTDDRHLQRYSLTAATMPTRPTAVGLGINWYEGFDRERLVESTHANGTPLFRIPPQDAWGRIRGGHAITIKPPSVTDGIGWYRYYDQGQEGACVGFMAARLSTLHNRERYDGRRIYQHAQRIDEWNDTPPEEGTSVRAGMDVLRGHGPYRPDGSQDATDGIATNRWARSVSDIAFCLDPASAGQRILSAGYVTLLNSWGTAYPHYVRLDLASLERLVFREDGDATVVTDK